MKGKILHTRGEIRAVHHPGFKPLFQWTYNGRMGLCWSTSEAEMEIEDIAGVQDAFAGKHPDLIIMDDPLSTMPDATCDICPDCTGYDGEITVSFSPSEAPPSPSKPDNGGGALCKFGPGGEYVRDYAPRHRKPGSWRQWIAAVGFLLGGKR